MDLLPDEILLHIFSYIDCETLTFKIKVLCKRFYEILSISNNWKFLHGKIYASDEEYYNIDDYGWENVCYYKSTERKFWQDENQHLSIRYLRGHIGAVDSVKLFNQGKYCVSGSRDKSINVWSLEELEQPFIGSLDGHTGWVWVIQEYDSIVYSGSWDHTVKIWDMNVEGQLLSTIRDIHSAAVLCLQVECNNLYTGCHDAVVRMFDTRANFLPNHSQLYTHKGAVLCMSLSDNYIVTGSDDKSVIVFEKRANRILRTMKTTDTVTTLHCGYGQLRAGVRHSARHRARHGVLIYNMGDGTFNELDTISDIHQDRITGIYHDLACMITSSFDRTIKVMESCQNPKTINTFSHQLSIARIDFCHGTLASACSDNTIGIIR